MKKVVLDLNRLVLQGLCLSCFYLNFGDKGESFVCAKYQIRLDGIVKDCPGFKPISEGLDELIARMQEKGELLQWAGQ